MLNGLETGVLLSDFAQQFRRKNKDVPDIYFFYFTLIDAADISPTLVLNQNAEAKERGSWVFFQKWSSEISKVLQAEWCFFLVCAQLSEG